MTHLGHRTIVTNINELLCGSVIIKSYSYSLFAIALPYKNNYSLRGRYLNIGVPIRHFGNAYI